MYAPLHGVTERYSGTRRRCGRVDSPETCCILAVVGCCACATFAAFLPCWAGLGLGFRGGGVQRVPPVPSFGAEGLDLVKLKNATGPMAAHANEMPAAPTATTTTRSSSPQASSADLHEPTTTANRTIAPTTATTAPFAMIAMGNIPWNSSIAATSVAAAATLPGAVSNSSSGNAVSDNTNASDSNAGISSTASTNTNGDELTAAMTNTSATPTSAKIGTSSGATPTNEELAPARAALLLRAPGQFGTNVMTGAAPAGAPPLLRFPLSFEGEPPGGSCPAGWACTGRVQICGSSPLGACGPAAPVAAEGGQFLMVGSADEGGSSATSPAFLLPPGTARLVFKQGSGVADDPGASGLALRRVRDGRELCASPARAAEPSPRSSADFSEGSCGGIDRYAGEAVYMQLRDLGEGVGGPVFFDDIRLQDLTGADLPHAEGLAAEPLEIHA